MVAFCYISWYDSFDVGCIEMHKLYINTVFCRLDVVISGLPCLNQSDLHSSGYSWVL